MVFTYVRNNIGKICIVYGLFASAAVIFSGLAGYWLDGLYGMKFQVGDCTNLLASGIGTGLIGFFKYCIDSIRNSPPGQFPGITKEDKQ